MHDDRTPRDDVQHDASGWATGAFRSVLRSLGALARGFDAASGAGPGVVDQHGDHGSDDAARKRRDYRP
jgi:hypothetical protein